MSLSAWQESISWCSKGLKLGRYMHDGVRLSVMVNYSSALKYELISLRFNLATKLKRK